MALRLRTWTELWNCALIEQLKVLCRRLHCCWWSMEALVSTGKEWRREQQSALVRDFFLFAVSVRKLPAYAGLYVDKAHTCPVHALSVLLRRHRLWVKMTTTVGRVIQLVLHESESDSRGYAPRKWDRHTDEHVHTTIVWIGQMQQHCLASITNWRFRCQVNINTAVKVQCQSWKPTH